MKDEKEYYGKYGGIVFDNNDPKLNGRIRCLVPKIGFETIPTNWAIACLEYEGQWKGPPNNSKVWVEFEGGDKNIPIWSGAFVGSPGGKSELPERAKGIDDGTEAFKGTDVVTLPTVSVNEPVSDFGAVYPKNLILKTKEGILVEYDDTPGKERIQLFHPTGSFIEMRSDGKVVAKTNDDLWETIGGKLVQHIIGNYLRKVDGNQEEESVNRLIEATLIKLGKTATDGLLLGNFGLSKYGFHTHNSATPGSPTGPPLPPHTYVALTDSTQKVKGE